MILPIKILINRFLLLVLTVAFLASCNKEPQQFPSDEQIIPGGLSLAGTLAATPDDSLYNRIVIRGA